MPARDLLLLLCACLIWAFNFIAAAAALQHFSPFLFAAMRFALVLVVVWPWLRLPPPDQWWRLATVALSIGALHFALMFWAMDRSADVTSVALLLQAYVPMSTLLAVVLLGERVGWKTTAGIAVSFGGVLVVGFDPLVLTQLDVLLLVLVSALFLAVGTVFMRGLRGLSAFGFQGWSAVFGLPPLLAMSLVTEGGQLQMIQSAGWLDWSGVVYASVISSVIGHSVYFRLLQRYEVTQVTPYLLLTPVLAAVLGVLVWGDRPGARLLVGGGMVLSGVLVIALRDRSKKSGTPLATEAEVI